MTVLVTGGGRGIGRAIALAFAAPGCLVAVAARTREQLESTAAEIRMRGGDGRPLTMDVGDESGVEQAFRELRSRSAQLDVLVNNAGVGGGEPIHKTDVGAWRGVLDTNVFGTFLVS